MSPGRPGCFEVRHQVVQVGGLEALRLGLYLWLTGPTGIRARQPFRIDTGADVSMVTEAVAVALGWRLEPWPGGRTPRAATGNSMRCRLARGVRYEFNDLRGYTFRTDFAVTPDLKGRDGLLAWRDLALDFTVRTLSLPRPLPDGSSIALPGVVQFCLRTDRLSDRVG